MKGGGKTIFASVICLWLAGGCQQAISPRLDFSGGRPDFLLIMLACLCMFANKRAGATIGFFSGWLCGALAGANLTAYIVTRTLVGLMQGWSNELEFEGSPVLAGLISFVISILAQLMLMFGVHHGPVLPFLTGTLITAATNGVLAMPVYALLRRILDPPLK